MGKNVGDGDVLSKLVDVLAASGPWPLVVLGIGVTFVLQLPKIISAASSAWKQQKETDQSLEHKRITFAKRNNIAITAKAPSATQARKSK